MPLVLADRVKDTTTTTGTGTVTLSGTPPTGYQAFSIIGDGNTTYYTIAGGSEWEVGIGTYSSTGPTLSRDTVLESSAGGTTKVTFSAGTKDVFVTYPADKAISDGYGTLPVTNGGTGTTTQFTSGSVVFAGASGVYSQDNANLFWDNTNKRLGIGTTAPVYGISVDDGVLSQRRYGVVGNFILQRADGTKGSPTAVASGVAVGGPTGQAYDGTDYRTIGAVRFVTNGATSGTNYGGDIIFVTGDPGATTATTKMRLDGYGQLGLGVTPSAWGSFYKAIESTSSSEFAVTSQQNGIEFGRGYYKINSGFASIATTTQATSKYAQDANGVHAWYYGTATTVGGTISFTQAMTLDASGSLGVGTTSPSSLGKFVVTGSVGSVYVESGATSVAFSYNGENYITAKGGASAALVFETGGANERMRIHAAGGVSIGTATAAGNGKLLVAKGILPRVNAQTTTTSPWAWNSDDYDQQSFSALANALTINADAGTPTDGEKQVLRFKDNGTTRTLTFTGGASKAFRDMTGQLTVSGSNWTYATVANKTTYFGCIYNNADSRWDIIAVTQEP